MANYSDLSRKEQVLKRLREENGYWVNTIDISNAVIGGSAGTSRVRDLRKEGYVIETRPHPDPHISQYQYRLVSEPTNPPQISSRLVVEPRGHVEGVAVSSHREGEVTVIDQMELFGVRMPHEDIAKPIARVTKVEEVQDGIVIRAEEL